MQFNSKMMAVAAAPVAGLAYFSAVEFNPIALGIFGVSLGVSLFFRQGSSGDVNKAIDAVEGLASGDLTQSVPTNISGEFTGLFEAVKKVQNQYGSILSGVMNSTGAITKSSHDIANGNANLSQRTEQQASSLEETASSMEELTSTVKNNADNAQQANQLASGARQLAEKGGAVVGDAINAMAEINSSSGKISEIISVIDEIAFQTNLLALNASVEAARAGEQGRGFAVVATEVRNLAQRSATAAKEIKDLINDSVNKVQAGSELVNESGETLTEIVDGIKKVGDIVSEIAASSQEQSLGIDQVNRAVTEMDEMTQQNASLAEETSSVSSSVYDQAVDMSTLMEFFTVAGTGTDGIPVPTSQRRSATTSAAAQSSSAQSSSAQSQDDWNEF